MYVAYAFTCMSQNVQNVHVVITFIVEVEIKNTSQVCSNKIAFTMTWTDPIENKNHHNLGSKNTKECI